MSQEKDGGGQEGAEAAAGLNHLALRLRSVFASWLRGHRIRRFVALLVLSTSILAVEVFACSQLHLAPYANYLRTARVRREHGWTSWSHQA